MRVINEVVDCLSCNSFVKKIYLFGSRSLGIERNNSDYDFCIVIDNEKNKPIVIQQLGSIMIKDKVIIHPYILTKKEFNVKMNMNIYKHNILGEGELLYEK